MPYLRLQELAQLVGVSRSTLEGLVARGALRTERVGRVRLVPVSAARALFPELGEEHLARVLEARRRGRGSRAARPERAERVREDGTGATGRSLPSREKEGGLP